MASILSAGNHSRDIQEIYYRARKGKELTVYDDNSIEYPKPPKNLSGRILIGVNDPLLRREIAGRWKHLKGTNPVIDPSVTIGPDVGLGLGVVVAQQTALGLGVCLGNHVHVNTCVSLIRALVGDFSTLSPGCVICGNVEIGEATLIGAGAVVCERTFIGNEVTVGAGAIIPPYSRVPHGAIVTGVWKNR